MPNVLYLPGLLGSQLLDRSTLSGSPIVYWLGEGLLGSRGLDPMQLAGDGISPGPSAGGIRLTAGDPLAVCYGPLEGYMRYLGWDVLALGYDWRMSIVQTGQHVAAAALARWGSEPLWMVAHSMGGLVARLAWRALKNQGRDRQLAGIVTIGTPHYGSWEIPRLWGRLPLTYQGIALACGLRHPAAAGQAVEWIDAVVSSWPGAYELMPCPSAGPLPADDPFLAGALYTRPFYSHTNRWVSGNALLRAQYTWSQLTAAVPPGRLHQIVGHGASTPYAMTGRLHVDDPGSYLYTDDGDGEVAGIYARLPGVPTVRVQGEHGLLCLLPSVWRAVEEIVQGAS